MGWATVCPKIRLGDLIRPRKGMNASKRASAFNRIVRKHVDFVVLRNTDCVVVGVIELDDKSHAKQARADRDLFVDDALKQAGIRVCRIKAQAGYDQDALAEKLRTAFA